MCRLGSVLGVGVVCVGVTVCLELVCVCLE